MPLLAVFVVRTRLAGTAHTAQVRLVFTEAKSAPLSLSERVRARHSDLGFDFCLN